MVSHASTVVHGFPNLFVLDGPNASLGHNSAVHVIESQLGYLLGALDHLAHRPGPLEVSAAAQRAYTADVDAMAAQSVWLRGGCSSWYVDARSGRLTLLWPDTATEFRRRNGTFDPAPVPRGLSRSGRRCRCRGRRAETVRTSCHDSYDEWTRAKEPAP